MKNNVKVVVLVLDSKGRIAFVQSKENYFLEPLSGTLADNELVCTACKRIVLNKLKVECWRKESLLSFNLLLYQLQKKQRIHVVFARIWETPKDISPAIIWVNSKDAFSQAPYAKKCNPFYLNYHITSFFADCILACKNPLEKFWKSF